MKTYVQEHRWNNVSCQEHSVLFLRLFTTLSATQTSWRATVILLTIFVKGIPLCDMLLDVGRLSCTELSIAESVLQDLACLGRNIQAINTSFFQIKLEFIACDY
jgi:hypothetical protein